jgi:hypothetical protein
MISSDVVIYSVYISSSPKLYDTTWLYWRRLCLPLDLLEYALSFPISFLIRKLLRVHRPLMCFSDSLQNPKIIEPEQTARYSYCTARNDSRDLCGDAPDTFLRRVYIDNRG